MSARRKPAGGPRNEADPRRFKPELTRSDFEEVAFPQQAKMMRILEEQTLEWFDGPDLDRLLAQRNGGSATPFLKLGVTPDELLALSRGIFSVLAKLGPSLEELEVPNGGKPGATLVPLAMIALTSALLPLHNLAYFAGYGADPLALVKDLERPGSGLEHATRRSTTTGRRGQGATAHEPIRRSHRA